MASTKASSKGQMIIPKSVREALDIRSGTVLDVELLPGKAFKVTIKPTDHSEQVRRLAGSLAHRARRKPPEEVEAAILKTLRADDERTKSHARRRR